MSFYSFILCFEVQMIKSRPVTLNADNSSLVLVSHNHGKEMLIQGQSIRASNLLACHNANKLFITCLSVLLLCTHFTC